MSSTKISLISFVCIFGAVLLGMLLRRVLPAEHLSADTKDAVKSGMGLAILLILGMYTPFSGLMQISSAPVRTALAQLGQ